MPKISVIIPCYNQGEYISETVNSVLNQTFGDFEIIIINDGSSDEKTIDIINKFTNPKITVFNNKNNGVSYSRNYGVEKSNGEYLLFLDADDILHENFLSKTYKILDDNLKIVIVTTLVRKFGKKEKLVTHPKFSTEELLFHNLLVITSLIRKKDFDKTNGFNENMKEGLEDWDFWISFIYQNKGEVYKIHEVLFYYRIAENSRNAKAKKKKIENYLIPQIVKNNSEVYYKYYSDLFKKYYKQKKKINSRSYKIGRFITFPFSILNKMINKIIH